MWWTQQDGSGMNQRNDWNVDKKMVFNNMGVTLFETTLFLSYVTVFRYEFSRE